jgi:glycosyltransferase involved in cell wall biosynthesis
MIVTGFPSREKPASGIFNFRAAKALQELVDVTVVHLRSWTPGRHLRTDSESEGIPVITLAVPQIPSHGRWSIAAYRVLGWLQLQEALRSCDVIHSVGADFAGVLSSAWSARAGIYHVTQVIGSDLNLHAKRWITHQAVGNSQGIACNSHALEVRFKEFFPRAKNVRTIFRGVDLNRFNPDGPAEGPLAQMGPVRFLFLGGFPSSKHANVGRNLKGGETLLAAWQAAEEVLHKCRSSLLIAGTNGYEYELISWRASLRYPGRVHITGAVPPGLVADCMRAADVVLVPSLYEGLPNVAMEASACGIAVFGSKVGGMAEVVEDGISGLLLPAGVVQSWSRALIAYSDQPMRLKAMGNAGRKRMEKVFDSAQYPEQMLDLYRVAMAEPLTALEVSENIRGRKAREAEWPTKPLSTR